MSENTMMDKLEALPKWLSMTLAAAVVGLLGFLGVYYGLGLNQRKTEDAVDPASLMPDMPDAATEDDRRSQIQTYRDGDVMGNSRSSVEDYWDNLGDDLVSSSVPETVPVDAGGENAGLGTGTYSEFELNQIQRGIRTRQEIDEEHRREREMMLRRSGVGSTVLPRPMTREEQDSAYMARLMMSAKVLAGYSAAASGEPEEEEESPSDRTAPMRTIPLQKEESVLPTGSYDGSDIISSLDSPSTDRTCSSGSFTARPVKATFLKNENLQSGQRAIIRLMQDLVLSDGTVIPANTHITGTCSFEKRFKIEVKMLHFAGRMFPVDLSVYDNDGTEGLYCPVVEDKNSKEKKKALKNVTQGFVGAAGSVAGTLLTGNPVLGAVASRSLSSVSGSISEDGTMAINVVAGYEFYILENVKENEQ